MEPIRIAPGLTLSTMHYETAAAGIAAHAPTYALTWEQFVHPAAWWLVPDVHGQLSKAELTLQEDPERTAKINIWFAADTRRPDGRPSPHSHPWTFRSYILGGGYTEDRYRVVDGQVLADLGQEHTEGSTNAVSRDLYHEVTRIHEPGSTMTLMLCGQGRRGTWGHLDPATGRCARPDVDPGFTTRLRALNPHR
ncbi:MULTISPECIES: hypothetical protein [Streptomycetaceae]|uniref:hypothetical protein n=1 Tax=Streptomycetaceae TaxID=2062 RepID=UPI00093BE8BF|nr:hypothetical protein [Streptomyces sp. CB02056]